MEWMRNDRFLEWKWKSPNLFDYYISIRFHYYYYYYTLCNHYLKKNK